jgi:hypothetical protein
MLSPRPGVVVEVRICRRPAVENMGAVETIEVPLRKIRQYQRLRIHGVVS